MDKISLFVLNGLINKRGRVNFSIDCISLMQVCGTDIVTFEFYVLCGRHNHDLFSMNNENQCLLCGRNPSPFDDAKRYLCDILNYVSSQGATESFFEIKRTVMDAFDALRYHRINDLRIFAMEFKPGPRLFVICSARFFWTFYEQLPGRYLHWYEVLAGEFFKIYMDLDYVVNQTAPAEQEDLLRFCRNFAEFSTVSLQGCLTEQGRVVSCYVLDSSSPEKISQHLIFAGIGCRSLAEVKLVVIQLLKCFAVHLRRTDQLDCLDLLGFKGDLTRWEQTSCLIDLVPYAVRQNFRNVRSHKWGKRSTLCLSSVFTTPAGWRDNTTTVDEHSTLIVDDVQLDDYITILEILQDDFEPFDGLLQDQFKLPRRCAQTIQSGIPIEQISASFRSLPENVRTYIHSYCHHFDCSISSIQQKSADLVVVNTSNRDCPV
ncbi:MAG: hypothetical protein GY861_27320, partial [bacterium]|nr:hypothetical protein [bacterium]